MRTQPNEAHRLRLGVPVVVKVDGDRGILDWEAMREAWGLGGQLAFLAQESMRSAPDDGIVDTARDIRVQSHLKKWTPTEATIVSLRRRTVMGMATLNWDIELQLPDGGRTLSKGDEVPSYAQWYAAPGAVVPAVVNPKDTGAASIDSGGVRARPVRPGGLRRRPTGRKCRGGGRGDPSARARRRRWALALTPRSTSLRAVRLRSMRRCSHGSTRCAPAT